MIDGFQTINLLWIAAALILAFSALGARNFSFRTFLRSLIGWAAIALVAFVAVAHRHEISGMFARVTDRLGLDDQQVQGKTVRIHMNPDGHFWARVSLNGVEKMMLIDSGATTTAISAQTARAAGISFDPTGVPVILDTANGSIAAKRGTLDQLSIGPLSTSDLTVVVSPKFGDLDVLGMNFLSRLKSWRVQDNVLILEPSRKPKAKEGDSDAVSRSTEE